MGFKPFRDSRPMNERPLEVQLEAMFFESISGLLSKKDQGRVMGAFRESLAKFKVTVEAKDEQTL